ncbi:MAG: ATP-dependent helicase [Myxococcales bacterium]|nr:ATP-dependent helicase [Myxococcales bacterium]
MLKDLRKRIRAKRAEGDAPTAVADLVGATAAPTPQAPAIAPELDDDARAALALADDRAPDLAKQLRQLDPWQQHAVLSEPKAAVVEAQVGSGKTTVLVHKVVFLHRVRQIPLSHMAVLTFTNKAAAEFRQRVLALLTESERAALPPEAMRWFGTFHSLARTLLANDLPITEVGFQPDFTVLDAAERMDLWQRLITGHRLTIKHQRRLGRRMELLQQGETRFGNMRSEDDIVRLAELAEAEKRARSVMDFDDLLANAHALLASHGVARPPAWLIVDELQDCDLDQLDLIDQLADEQTQRFYVGDPNQVIYSWRGSAPQLFRYAREQHGAKTFSLPINYRSSATIVEAARAFIQGSGRLDAAAKRTSALVPSRHSGEPIAVVICHDPRAEASWLARQIELQIAAGIAPEDIAVIARTRRRLVQIRAALKGAELPVAETGQLRQQPAAVWLGHLLNAGLGHGDLHSAILALSHPEFGVVAARDLMMAPTSDDAEAPATPGTPAHALVPLAAHLRKRARKRKGIDRALAANITDRLIDLSTRANTGVTPDELMSFLLVAPQLDPTRGKFAQDLTDCRQFLQNLMDTEQRTPSVLPQSEYLARRLRRKQPRTTAKPHVRGVALSTMHAAKGLEWKTVFMLGLNAGAVPLSGAMRDPAQLSEERRLFFVALTRARDHLCLSWCRSPDDPREQEQPSPFVHLLPAHLLDVHDHPADVFQVAAPPQEEASTESHTATSDNTVGPANSTQAADKTKKFQDNQLAAATREASLPTDAPWFVGQQVRHARYGAATVTALDATWISCDFGARGPKRFSVAMCPLVAVDRGSGLAQ